MTSKLHVSCAIFYQEIPQLADLELDVFRLLAELIFGRFLQNSIFILKRNRFVLQPNSLDASFKKRCYVHNSLNFTIYSYKLISTEKPCENCKIYLISDDNNRKTTHRRGLEDSVEINSSRI